MKKVVAYSIVELIVVMIISTILIAFSYSAWEFTAERSAGFKNKQEFIFEHELFISQFQRDFTNCISARRKQQGLVLQFDTLTKSYSFNDSIGLSMNQQMVYFPVKVKESGFRYRGETQNIDDGIVDQVSLFIQIQDKDSEVQFSKLYGADILLGTRNE